MSKPGRTITTLPKQSERSALQQELARLAAPPLLESLRLFHRIIALALLRIIEVIEK